MFAGAFVSKQLLSLKNLNEYRFRSQLTDAHLNSSLKVATAQFVVPDINMLVNAKRFQVSSSCSAVNKYYRIFSLTSRISGLYFGLDLWGRLVGPVISFGPEKNIHFNLRNLLKSINMVRSIE